jgi:hypothetical protein
MNTDTVACGPVQRTLLAIGAPVILFIGGLWSFLRTYQLLAGTRHVVGLAGRRLVPTHLDVAGPHDGTAPIAWPAIGG